ncbi:MAG: hypothetical protein MUC78_02240, partial [Bacteroidales bacterium]|nr:hypothetical protein [Bacteroidales bacterium]
MKNLAYIIPAVIIIASSCSSPSSLGVTNDDLYFRPSDEQVVIAETTVANKSSDQLYYDNIFASDTLVADNYVPAEEYAAQYGTGTDATIVNNYYGGSAAERVYLFNDGIYPYWNEPYYSPFSLSLSFGIGYGFGMGFGYGYPYYPYSYGWYDPFWGYPYYPYYGYGGYPYYGYGGYPCYGCVPSPCYDCNDGSEYISRRGGYSTSKGYTTSGTRSNKSAYTASGTSTSSRRTGAPASAVTQTTGGAAGTGAAAATASRRSDSQAGTAG